MISRYFRSIIRVRSTLMGLLQVLTYPSVTNISNVPRRKDIESLIKIVIASKNRCVF